MLSKILVANRGEIAVRIMRTAREMAIATVAVYSEADRNARHVEYADEAFLVGPASPSLSYLNVERILEVASSSGADAIHPGYGFLAENAAFARQVIAAGLTWIGPHPDAIDAMGDKLRARQAMQKAHVPFVPGSTASIDDLDAARAAASQYGLPLALKASGGGGGKGLKVARSLDELESAFTTAKREAAAYFKNDVIYAERYLENPKHIELQILADKHGNVVHVGERDCSLQRRHQKLWEEGLPNITARVRDGLRDAGMRAAKTIGYDSVGTIEYLVSGDEFYFLEMNTRIQVEHTVSEMISGLDLVREQIRVAAGEPLGYSQDAVHFSGHAIEGRINAEDPAQNFRPAPGTIAAYREPAGLGIRVDSAARSGYVISPDYDSMIAKLVVWAPDRAQAIARMRRALDEYVIEGVPTTIPLLRALCDEPHVADASYGTATLETFAAAHFASNGSARENESNVILSRGARSASRVEGGPSNVEAQRAPALPSWERKPPRMSGKRAQAQARGDDVVSPMHGVVVELNVKQGDTVEDQQVVAIVEAMKMMNEIRAHKAGTVNAIHATAGATVESDSPILTIS